MTLRLFPTLVFSAAVFVLCVGIISPAYADKGGKHGNGHSSGYYDRNDDHYSHRDTNQVTIRIGLDDRNTIETYLRDDNRAHCPPGLAKKRNGCLPPGQAKKYRVGNVLDVDYAPVPRDLLRLLSPAPRGYTYVQVDKDVLLIGEATKKVVDAVTLLSAVGR